jgi:hypothetical protein
MIWIEARRPNEAPAGTGAFSISLRRFYALSRFQQLTGVWLAKSFNAFIFTIIHLTQTHKSGIIIA